MPGARQNGTPIELTQTPGVRTCKLAIRTKISATFTQEAVKSELTSAGLELENFFTDDHCLFGPVVARHAGR